MRKCFYLLAAFIFMAFTVQAQNKGSLKGSLQDSVSKQVVSLATVTVFQAHDTAIITYRLSDPNGNFNLTGLPLNLLCRVVITYQGYKTYRKEFTLTKENPQLNLGKLLLSPDPQMLDNVVIIAERPPVVMRNDTLEFNASAFKSLPSALLEDLLKKLPGVDIDPEGNMTVNGKKVNRLLVDGKEFFGGDNKMATRNLPANIVDKIQVSIDKEEQDANPLAPKDEIGQIVNIKLKKAINQGWFGKAYAGGGSNGRHEAGAIINMFRDTAQMSVLGYSNNVNKPGFSMSDIDKIGGFNRSGDANGLANNFSQGIQQSRGGGFNYNNIFAKKFTVNLQYFLGRIDNNFEQRSNGQRFFADTVISTTTFFSRNNINTEHRISGSVTWRDSLSHFTFRPGITISKSRSKGNSTYSMNDNYKGAVNSNTGENRGLGNNISYNQSISYSKSFKKRGRSANINSNISINNHQNNNYNDNIYILYYYNSPKDSGVYQLRGTGNKNIRGNINLNYNEPISKTVSLTFANQLNYLSEDHLIDFYDMDVNTGYYNLYNWQFSNNIERAGWKNTASSTLSINIKKLSVRPGISVYWAQLQNNFMRNPGVNQNLLYVNPTLNISWKGFNFNYRRNINEPSANELQEVIDISNPFFKSYGNPHLQPTLNHNTSLSYYKYTKKANSFNSNINTSYNKDAIMRKTVLDSRRVQETTVINIDNTFSLNANINYNKQHKFNKNFRMSLTPYVGFNFNRNFVSFNNKISEVKNQSVNATLRTYFNFKDLVEINQRYTLNNTQNRYQDQSRYKNVNYYSHSAESELVIRWPKRFAWENLVSYIYNPQVSSGIKKTIIRWNASASLLFLKQDKGQIKLSVYDALNQNVNAYRYTFENFISDGQTTTLHRYYMLSFIYNIRNFSSSKASSKGRTYNLF